MQTDAVWIIGAGALQASLIKEAKGLGLYVIATDRDSYAPGITVADDFYPIDTSDILEHQVLAHDLLLNAELKIRGCVTAGADVAPTVSAVCEVLRAPRIPLEVAERTHNKFEVRTALDAHALTLYQPQWCLCSCDDAFAEVLRYIDEGPRWPCVVKPLEERASRGVTLVRNISDVRRAIEKVYDYGSEYLIEQCLTGTEHSAEAILGAGGKLLWWNVVDRFFDYRHGLAIELGHINPTHLPPEAQRQIQQMLLAAAQALGVTWGPFKIDCMMTDEGPKVLEITARLSGGWDSQWTSPVTGRHPMRLLLQLACNLPLTPSIHQAGGYGAAVAIIPQKSGTVLKLPYKDGVALDVERVNSMEIVWSIKEGDTIQSLQHNAQRAGFALTHAATYHEAWDMGEQAAETMLEMMEIV